MQTRVRTQNLWRIALVLGLAALALWARTWIFQSLRQALGGALLALAALPLARLLEKRLHPGLAAALALLTLAALAVGGVMLLLPILMEQMRGLAARVPELLEALDAAALRMQRWMQSVGLRTEGGWRHALAERGQELISAAAPRAAGWIGQAAGNVGKWLLSPVLAFYFLRDRREIGRWLLSLVPLGKRRLTVRILREMRRETAGYLRGQLLVSMLVGVLTAVSLFLCGLPAWLALGVIMGVMEMIPYVGPVAGGALAVLFALPLGLVKTGWTLAAVVAVQQAEGMFLSPRLMGEATRLHPLAVIFSVTAGGAAAGMSGILFSVPLVLCVRAALRVLALRRFDAGT